MFFGSNSDATFATAATGTPVATATIATMAKNPWKHVVLGRIDRRNRRIAGCDDPRR